MVIVTHHLSLTLILFVNIHYIVFCDVNFFIENTFHSDFLLSGTYLFQLILTY